MEFNVNSPVLFILAGIIILLVLAQSVFFLVKAIKRSKELGMDQKKIKKTIAGSAVFTIAPAVAIVIGVITLSQSLGIPLPWLRLSVVGSLTYETVAAQNALSPMGMTLGNASALTASQYVTIAFVMTISILLGIWLVTIIGKKIQTGIISLEKRDAKWSDIFTNSLFIGMISAFLGYVFCNVSSVSTGDFSGLIPVLVMLVSAVVMCLCGLLQKLFHWRFISDYALPISLVIGMASAIPITGWLS